MSTKPIGYRIILTKRNRGTKENTIESINEYSYSSDIHSEIKSIINSTFKLVCMRDTMPGIEDFDPENLYTIINRGKYNGYIFYGNLGIVYYARAYRLEWSGQYRDEEDGHYKVCKYRSHTVSQFSNKIYITNKDGVVIYESKDMKNFSKCFDIIDRLLLNTSEIEE